MENEFFTSRNFWGTQIWLKLAGLRNREKTLNYKSNHASFTLPLGHHVFWGRAEQIFRNGPCRYLGSWKFKANIWIFQIPFSHWIAPLRKKLFSVFYGTGVLMNEKDLIQISGSTRTFEFQFWCLNLASWLPKLICFLFTKEFKTIVPVFSWSSFL